MLKRLRRRFVLVAMCAMAAVLFVIMGAVNLANWRELDARADAVLALLAENGGAFPKALEPGRQLEPRPDAQRDDKLLDAPWMSAETPYETRFFSVTLDAEGNVAGTDVGSIAAVTGEEAVDMARRAAASGRESGYDGNYKYLVTQTASGTQVLFLDRARELAAFRSFLGSSVLMSLAGLLAALGLVLIFSRRALRPVAESYAKQKRFITDAGHELKTPLTVIDAACEALELEQGGSRWTRSIRNQTSRLAELTASLVALSRMDEGVPAAAMVDFSLSDAVQEAAEPFAAPAEAAGKRLALDLDPGLSLTGDEQAIRRLVSILLDNAVKYAEAGGEIRMTLRRQGRACVLACRNPAAAPPEGELERLFDRFYRGDAARSSPGFGVGLSMARAIAEAHRGKLTARREGGDIVFTATL